MPWDIVKDTDRCSVSKPWAVVKESDDELIGCHSSRKRALSQVAALEASEAEGDKMGNRDNGTMEHKTLSFELTGLDYEGRTFEGYAACFSNLDAMGDVIHQGAFTKTLVERGNKVKLLWQHDTAEPIGKPLSLNEDEKGLFMSAVISDTARGRDALALLRDGAINELSIGYDSIKGGVDFTKEGDETVRNLRELRLWEVSLVTFPANSEAVVTALKEDDKDVDTKEDVVELDDEKAAELDEVQDEEKSAGDAPETMDVEPDGEKAGSVPAASTDEAGDMEQVRYQPVESVTVSATSVGVSDGNSNTSGYVYVHPPQLSEDEVAFVKELVKQMKAVTAPAELQVASEEIEQEEPQAGPDDGGMSDDPPTSRKAALLKEIDIELELLEVSGNGPLQGSARQG